MAKITRREFVRRTALGAAGVAVGGTMLGQTAKKAFAQNQYPFRGKVVEVYDENVLDDRNRIDQEVVKKMIDAGIKELTGESDLLSAWRLLLPDLQPGDKVGIKINCIARSRDLRNHKEVVDNIIESLKSLGVAEDNIILWDMSDDHLSRLYPINRTGPGVKCYAAPFNVPNDSENPNAGRFSQILADARYIINAPILKFHAKSPRRVYAGLTFALKNYVGAVSDRNGAAHPEGRWEWAFNLGLIADLNTQSHIKQKSKVVIGEALMSSTQRHGGGPADFFPKKILFATDPVACDAVGLEILREYKGGTTSSLYYRRARAFINRARDNFDLGESQLSNIDRVLVDTTGTSIKESDTRRDSLQNHSYLTYPSLRIPYQVNQNSRVKIKIYNSLGQLIRELDLGLQSRGRKVAFWDRRDSQGRIVRSGNYFFNIQVGRQVNIRKSLLLK
jgi:uncharacterized protein (DUF362 family)